MKTVVLILVNVYIVHGYGECFPEMVNKTYLHLPPQNGPPVVNTPSNEECFQLCVENVKCIAYTFKYNLECSLFHLMPDIELPEKEIPCQGHCLTRYLSLPHWCKDTSNDTPFSRSHLTRIDDCNSFGVLCKNQLKMQLELKMNKELVKNLEKKHQDLEMTVKEMQIQLSYIVNSTSGQQSTAYPLTRQIYERVTCDDGTTPQILPATMIKCSASSTYDTRYTCSKALQGPYQRGDPGRAWATRGQGVGAWIQLDFNVPTVVKMVRLLQRYLPQENVRRVRFEYVQDNTYEEATLSFFGSYDWNDISLYRFTPIKSVRIKVMEVTPTYNVRVTNIGFKGIQIIGCPTL